MVREQDDKAQGRETRQPESPHIVKLVPTEQARVDASIVEKLELALDRARDGEFDAIAIGWCHPQRFELRKLQRHQ